MEGPEKGKGRRRVCTLVEPDLLSFLILVLILPLHKFSGLLICFRFWKLFSLWLLLYVPVLCLLFLLSHFQEESSWVINSGWIWTFNSSATDPKKLGLWACATRTIFCTLYFLLLFFYFSILFIPFKLVSLIHKILNSPIYQYTNLINTNHIIYYFHM